MKFASHTCNEYYSTENGSKIHTKINIFVYILSSYIDCNGK